MRPRSRREICRWVSRRTRKQRHISSKRPPSRVEAVWRPHVNACADKSLNESEVT